MTEHKQYILNPEQFAFMQAHHPQIAVGMSGLIPEDFGLIDALINSKGGFKSAL
jgi:hypothetical protein